MDKDVKLSKNEKSTLYWASLGSGEDISSSTYHPGKYYTVCSSGYISADELLLETIISLIEKKMVIPFGLSIKEWKVQVALGTNDKIVFTLTTLGEQRAIDHLNVNDQKQYMKERQERKKNRNITWLDRLKGS